jgi:hypothetical protein
MLDFYINFNRYFDINLFKVWLNHYNLLNLNFGIYVQPYDKSFCIQNYPLSVKNIIETIPTNVSQLTEKDFLFSYKKSDIDIMLLSYNIDTVEFREKSICIGRIFSVPVKNKLFYSTFEIPDFILYKHANHTNFTLDGIKINNNTEENIKPSDSIVCITLNHSKVAYENEYYETNILINKFVLVDNKYIEPFFRIYYEHYCMNVIVNKEKQYGIIWYPKCGCTTITDIFCMVNNIELEEDAPKRSLNHFLPQYRYNIYLQNIELITFVRNPYERFLSSYIDKHIYKTDNIYMKLNGYLDYKSKFKKDCILNVCYYLQNNGYISDHYVGFSNFNKKIKYFQDLKSTVYKIEDNLNEKLINFLKKYHNNIDIDKYLHKHDNSICKKNNSNEKITTFNIYTKKFDEKQWEIYLQKNNIDYNLIINNDNELKELLYNIYKNDFIQFGYNK